MSGPLRGTIAAAVTPLGDGGARLDLDGFDRLVEFLVAGGVDGILALGTTGEGIMLSPDERRTAAERFLAESRGRLSVAVHCGAQTTAETVALAAHAAEHGADAVAVIAPPYYPFDDAGLLSHFREAARACHPLPFYVYVFSARSGYPIPPGVLLQLRDEAPNLAGMKVSETPFDRFEPYLLKDLDVLVGPEALIVRGLERGAVGAVSALASAFPELVSRLVREPEPALGERVGELRAAIQRLPMPAALKEVLALRGVPITGDVRAPLRGLTDAERKEVAAFLDRVGSAG
ncbi:MAG: dihydrodipicolinate synthase family protein [Actinomycetota bacterium]|nr:dihydrodipicolinate synthase family protein [Actinomycetota bacterium]